MPEPPPDRCAGARARRARAIRRGRRSPRAAPIGGAPRSAALAVEAGPEGRGARARAWASVRGSRSAGWSSSSRVAVLAQLGVAADRQPDERHRVVRPQGSVRRRGHRPGLPARLRQQRSRHDRRAWRYGAWSSLVVADRRRRPRVPRRRLPRPHRRVTSAARPTRSSPGAFNVLLSIPGDRPGARARRVPPGRPRAAGERVRRLLPRPKMILIIAIGVVVDPAARPDHARERAQLVAARVRARGARPGREERSDHDPRGAARTCCRRCSRSRCSASRSRSSPRARSRSSASVCSRRRRRGATSSPSTAATSTARRTSCSSPSILIFLTVLALNFLGDVVRARLDVREGGL